MVSVLCSLGCTPIFLVCFCLSGPLSLAPPSSTCPCRMGRTSDAGPQEHALLSPPPTAVRCLHFQRYENTEALFFPRRLATNIARVPSVTRKLPTVGSPCKNSKNVRHVPLYQSTPPGGGVPTDCAALTLAASTPFD